MNAPHEHKVIFGLRRDVLVLAIIAAVAEAAYAAVNMFALTFFVANELGLTAYLGLIGATFLLVEALMKSPMGIFSDRYGRRPFLIIAPMVSGITAISISFFNPPAAKTLGALLLVLLPILALRAVDGLAAAAFWPTMFSAVAEQAEEGRRTSSMSVLTVAYLIGVAVGPAAAGQALQMTGNQHSSWYVVGVLFLITTLVAFILAPRHRHGNVAVTHQTEESMSFRELLRAIGLAFRTVPQLVLMAFVVFLGVGLLYHTVGLYAVSRFNMEPAQFGKMFLAPALVIGLIVLPLGRLGDRWGHTRSVHVGFGLAIMAMWAMAAVAALPQLASLRHPTTLTVGATVLTIGFVMGLPAWLATVSASAPPTQKGRILGAVMTAEGLGAFCGDLVGPVLYVKINPNAPVLMAGVFLTIGWFISLWGVRMPASSDEKPELAHIR